MTSQPQPTSNDEPWIHNIVAADIMERQRTGIRTYGAPLQPNNGRDALWDAYEEALDLACYLRQAIFERDDEVVT